MLSPESEAGDNTSVPRQTMLCCPDAFSKTLVDGVWTLSRSHPAAACGSNGSLNKPMACSTTPGIQNRLLPTCFTASEQQEQPTSTIPISRAVSLHLPYSNPEIQSTMLH
eukprot:gnl/MRDRNA2_/MRDRNA2_84656_c0_seq1.p1 gnl/MRDRNA2_/MRDRNA2_84656_c0~~gnl/MRDRNA2_/MRDRNA2_84656_c0_seq1.p1  ORF type:complete len:110 (-),score=9.93 gnl/MRDRNA2_/MRDRNA2_84656_c0_seq1:474-803(-)